MAGHSKWANIKHRKAHADARKGKVFTRLIKEITVAARLGGGDAASNPRLRLALEKAREQNMPSDNITRAIRRGTGELEGTEYLEIRYEGYGPGGVAVLVDCLTDNRTRTVAEVRHAFAKYGGQMGQEGSVAFLFKHCGQLLFEPGFSADVLMEAAITSGAEDMITHEDGSAEVICAPEDLPQVAKALAPLKPAVVETVMRPNSEADIPPEHEERLMKLLEALDNLDDVQDVYANAHVVIP